METQFDRHIEALIFSAPTPITVEEIRAALEEALQQVITDDDVTRGIDSLFARYQDDAYGFEPAEMAGGYQFLTKGAYHNTISVHLKLTTKKRLSQAAMETLALIAYKQPVTKSELEQLRGVSCDYAIQKLLEKELVHITGRSDGPGKPLLYATSDKFMDYMGIRSMDDLPKPKDFKEMENMVGESLDLTDYVPEASAPTGDFDDVEDLHAELEPETADIEIGDSVSVEIEDMIIDEIRDHGALDEQDAPAPPEIDEENGTTE